MDRLGTVTETPIDHGSPEPPYRQIAAALIREIESGALAVGRPVPSQPTLVTRYGVARATVQNAMRYLQEQGYVYTVPKRGTYVADRSKHQQPD
ncbi:GntR family transcriptional regulator [Streptomyces tateyamensis]|uniref:GntR family transcriptional regulator n=1 Tax=Streptomyces tateyamensis TaxID=565073 RepID=A0A2V4N3K3_9ACTN|nr:winged helix-turn-helix domain-containing protein [Streptomyces tateyamensis]PYC78615.1 GntR family transcriptional regulator [Streptomyces tateyamensis]